MSILLTMADKKQKTSQKNKKEKSVYEQIKKQNGESFARQIRDYDNGIFEVPHIVSIVQYAGRDATDILNWLSSLKQIQISTQQISETPFELLKKAGYDAFLLQSEKDKTALKHYFAPHEEICTLRDKHRLALYHIIFAVKENALQLNRDDFPYPEREDEYGRSVITIQLLKTGGSVFITNRYNSRVMNCDNTFYGNPDNIIVGLGESLRRYFDVDFVAQNVRVPNGFIVRNNQLIKVNKNINGVYFGNGFYVQDNQIHAIDKDSQISVGDFVIDLKNRKVIDIAKHTPKNQGYALLKAIQNEVDGKNLTVCLNERQNKCLYADDVQILELKDGNIIALHLETTKQVEAEFLRYEMSIESFSASQLTCLPNNAVTMCPQLKQIKLDKCQLFQNGAVSYLKSLTDLQTPELKMMGRECICSCPMLEKLSLSKLEKIYLSISNNSKLKELICSNVQTVSHAVRNNPLLEKTVFSKVKELIGGSFCFCPNVHHLNNDGPVMLTDYARFEKYMRKQLNILESSTDKNVGLNFFERLKARFFQR